MGGWIYVYMYVYMYVILRSHISMNHLFFKNHGLWDVINMNGEWAQLDGTYIYIRDNPVFADNKTTTKG